MREPEWICTFRSPIVTCYDGSGLTRLSVNMDIIREMPGIIKALDKSGCYTITKAETHPPVTDVWVWGKIHKKMPNSELEKIALDSGFRVTASPYAVDEYW